MYITLPQRSPEGFNAADIIVRLRTTFYFLKKAPQLCNNDINSVLLSLGYTKSSADLNLSLGTKGIQKVLYVHDISVSYAQATAKSSIEINAKLSGNHTITQPVPAYQFIRIKILPKETSCGISLCQKTDITIIVSRFNMEHTYTILTPMDPNINLNVANDRGEKELPDITDNPTVVGSLMYPALASQPDIS